MKKYKSNPFPNSIYVWMWIQE